MRRRGVLVGAVAGALLLVIAAAVIAWSRPSAVEASLAVLDDDGRFTTAIEASDAFAEISSRLDVDCDAGADAQCARLLRASAWARVTAVLVAQCTPPVVFEARAGLGRYLRGGAALPSAPRCGERRQRSSS